MIRLLPLFLLVILLAGCDRPSGHSHKQQMYVFGTLVEVVIWTDDEQGAAQAITTLGQQFQQWHRQWHAWDKGGDLAGLNLQLAAGEQVPVPPTIQPLLTKAIQLSHASGGRFDPSVGKLVQMWGFSDSLTNATQPPSADQLAEFLAHAPHMEDLVVEQGIVHSNNPNLHLDFGGFAKGYAVDRAIEQLQAMGFTNAIVNAGGDLRAIGDKEGWPWRIGIRDPRGEGLIASVEVSGDESVFTSGDYERYFDYQGHRYHHIIDPATGYPAEGLSSVTILYNEAAVADAAATALLVAGPKAWQKVASDMGLDKVMVIDTQGNIQMTRAMQQRVHFEVSPTPPVEVLQ